MNKAKWNRMVSEAKIAQKRHRNRKKEYDNWFNNLKMKA